MKRIHFCRFFIAGFSFYEGAIYFGQMSNGTPLELLRDAQNKHDSNAIAIYFNDSKIGYVPKSDNEPLSKLFDAGYANLFECYIQQLAPEQHPERQVGVIVYLKTNNTPDVTLEN